MGNSNEVKKLPENDPEVNLSQNVKKVNSKKVEEAEKESNIIESKEETEYKLPEDLQNREKVRECINKYNDKIELEMKKKYVQDFFSMREKLLNSMENTCKESYPVPKGKIGKDLKECMQSVQSLISEEDERMQVEFGTKLFLLADKCLMKEERIRSQNSSKDKTQKKETNSIDNCVDKLVKYRNLNMEMHILKLELARELL